MKKFSIHNNFKEKELMDLLLFASRKSDRISLSRYFYGKLTFEEFNEMQKDYKELIVKGNNEARFKYLNNINGYREWLHKIMSIRTKEDADKYFDDVLEQDIEVYNLVKYEDFINSKHERFYGNTADFLYTKFTRDTPVTRGPVFEVCHFSIGDTFREIMTNMHELFEYPYFVNDYEFENLCFYKGERIVLAICSHERFAYMNLEDKEYGEILKLNILHDLIN